MFMGILLSEISQQAYFMIWNSVPVLS